MKSILTVFGFVVLSSNAFASNLGTFLSRPGDVTSVQEVILSDDKQALVIRDASGGSQVFKATSDKSIFSNGSGLNATFLDADEIILQGSGYSPTLLSRIESIALQKLQDLAKETVLSQQKLQLQLAQIQATATVIHVCSTGGPYGGTSYYEVAVTTYRGTTQVATSRVTPLTQAQMVQYVNSDFCR